MVNDEDMAIFPPFKSKFSTIGRSLKSGLFGEKTQSTEHTATVMIFCLLLIFLCDVYC